MPGILAGDGCKLNVPTDHGRLMLRKCPSFIVEGAITAVIAVIGYFWLMDWPDNATFLTPEERVVLLARLRADRTEEARMEKFNAKRCWGDWKIWIG